MPHPTITSRRHALVARCRDAADGHTDELLLEGPHLVAEGLAAGLSLAEILVAEGADMRPDIRALVARLHEAGAPLHWVTPSVLDAASPTRTPTGIVALTTHALVDLDGLLSPPPALVTVAIGVQDPGNVGTLVRSSEAAGATGLLAAGQTAHPFGWKALRGAMGSSLRLPIARDGDVLGAIRALQARGLRVVALAADAATRLGDADLAGPLAVCAGAEGAGLPRDVVAAADLTVRIPMRPPVESLNVGVATSLVLFEIARRRAAGAEVTP